MTPVSQPLWYRFRRFESVDFAIIRVMQKTGICGFVCIIESHKSRLFIFTRIISKLIDSKR